MQMPYCDWEDENWDALILSIQEKDCILMLGPDAAVEEVNGKHYPLTEILAGRLAKKIDPSIKEHIAVSDLFQVAQYYSMEPGKKDLIARVKAFYEARENLTTGLHRNLAALPFYFTITTNPDNMFPTALREAKKEPVTGLYNFNNKKQEPVKITTDGNPLVFYLYGNIAEPKSLLLTEKDLLDFLVALISKNPALQDNIRGELQNEDKSFLFFGFGFRRWCLRILLHVLQGSRKNSRSFALEQFIPLNSNELMQTVFFFKKSDHKIHIFKQDFNTFAEELRRRYEQCTPGQISSQVSSARGPRVFISYTGKDKEYAASLYKKLEEAGLKPWLDKENLRGGDDWYDVIEKTVKEEIDYFIVLQSKALHERIESYVFEEIKHALKRKDRFRTGIRFIFPVKIGDCPLEEKLKHIQTVDLTDEANFDRLVSDIKRDFEKREKQ